MKKLIVLQIVLFTISSFSEEKVKMPLSSECYDWSAPRGTYTVVYGNLPNSDDLKAPENIEKVETIRKENQSLLQKKWMQSKDQRSAIS